MESNLLLAAQSPICLDPSTDVACVNNRLCYNQLKYNCHSVKRYLYRRSHATQAKKLSTEGKVAIRNIQEYFKQRSSSCRKVRYYTFVPLYMLVP